MRAIQFDEYGGPEVLQLRDDVPVPVAATDEVLIKVRAASVNPIDPKLRSGFLRNFFELQFPAIPGRDGAGEIVEVGTDVTGFAPGDRVAFFASSMSAGTMAEYTVCKATNVTALPGNLNFIHGAAFPSVELSAWISLAEAANVQPGMRVLIQGGSGGVGTLAIQIARHLGADVTATCSTGNVTFVESLGAKAVDYTQPGAVEALSGFDVALDLVGGDSHRQCCAAVKSGGKVIYLIAKPFEDCSAEFNVTATLANVHGNTRALPQVAELIEAGIVTPIVGKTLPMSEISNAQTLIQTGPSRGKIVIEID